MTGKDWSGKEELKCTRATAVLPLRGVPAFVCMLPPATVAACRRTWGQLMLPESGGPAAAADGEKSRASCLERIPGALLRREGELQEEEDEHHGPAAALFLMPTAEAPGPAAVFEDLPAAAMAGVGGGSGGARWGKVRRGVGIFGSCPLPWPTGVAWRPGGVGRHCARWMDARWRWTSPPLLRGVGPLFASGRRH